MDTYEIAVIDIGKTNKKILIYDQDLNLVDIAKTNIEEFRNEETLIHDDLSAIETWILSELKKFSCLYKIMAISISTHGATFTCCDKDGNLTVPELSYTTDPGQDFQNEFYRQFGDRKYLQENTGSPDFKLLLNVAKGIWFVRKKWPLKFEKTKYIFNLPQYFGFRLTGVSSTDPTYTGCHTYLWDFNKSDYSVVVDKMDIRSKLPANMKAPWAVLGKILPPISEYTGLSADAIVTNGIHDSNASLLPHLIKSGREEFILNSTGTWCVIMHPQEEVHFAEEELGKVVFYNLSAFSKPVKTAIFMGGIEYETYSNLIHRINPGFSELPFNPKLYQQVIDEGQCFILPGITEGTGQFPESKPRIVEGDHIYAYHEVEEMKKVPSFLRNPDKALAVLNLSLAMQTKTAIDRTNMKKGIPIFTEGGFCHNEAYNALISACYPLSKVYLTNLVEATAFGTALLAKAAIEKKHPMEYKSLMNINREPVPTPNLRNLGDYYLQFLQRVG